MRFSNRLTNVFAMIFEAIVFCAFSAIALGQNNSAEDSETKPIVPSEIKTLEQVRNLGAWGTDATISFFDLDASQKPTRGTLPRNPSYRNVYSDADDALSLTYRMSPPDPRQVALKKIEAAKAKLAADEDRSVVEPLLKAALAEYFIADMRHRVRELDDIKAKIAESEAKLQKRLDSQQESVDLQLKIMLREADGHGFFRREDVQSGNGQSSPSSRPSATDLAPADASGRQPSAPTFNAN